MKENECRNIYRQAFCDPDTRFEDMLFKFCGDCCRTLEVGEKTVSMLFALPITVKTEIGDIDGAYIYAAATESNSRKNGYMSKLLESIKAEYNITLLRPANEPLISYYGNLGFKKVLTDIESDISVIPLKGYKELIDKSGLNDNGEQYVAMYYTNGDINIEKLNFNYSMN